jgi:HK97 family phage major capsid protein
MQMTQTEMRRRITAAMQSPEPGPNEFSLVRALRAMADTGGLFEHSSHEGAVCAMAAEADGHKHDPNRIRVPIRELVKRDLNATTNHQGGALVGSTVAPTISPLRPYSVTQQAGATVLYGLRDTVLAPRINADATAVWLSTEASPATESNLTIGQYAMTPHPVSAYVECSRQLLLQGAYTAETISVSLLRAVGIALDRACLVGSGTAGEPAGVSVTPGIGTASGTSLAWAGVLSARASAVQAVGSDQNISWIGGSVAQQVLGGRERAAGSGFIWDYGAAALDGTIAGHRAFATSACPNNALFLGDWSQLLVGVYGESVIVELNPYANFPAGIVGFRVILPCDVAVVAPAYFSHIPAIT